MAAHLLRRRRTAWDRFAVELNGSEIPEDVDIRVRRHREVLLDDDPARAIACADNAASLFGHP